MDVFTKTFQGIGNGLKRVLPTSPFTEFLEEFKDIPYLGYLNWFVPIRGILIVLTAWLAAVALFQLYSIVMRWLKVLGD